MLFHKKIINYNITNDNQNKDKKIPGKTRVGGSFCSYNAFSSDVIDRMVNPNGCFPLRIFHGD